MIASRTAAAAVALFTLAGGPAAADVMADSRECASLVGPAYARRAVDVCSRALQSGLISDKVRVTNLVRRGDGYRNLGAFEEAIRDYTEALALGGPQTYEAWFGRGLAQSGMGRFDAAIEDLTRAAELRRNDATMFLARGNAYAGKGEFARAVEDYDVAIGIDGTSDEAYYSRATAHNRLRNGDAAIADYQRAMALGGEPVVLDLQSYLKVKGKYQGALDGRFGPASMAALRACIADPGC